MHLPALFDDYVEDMDHEINSNDQICVKGREEQLNCMTGIQSQLEIMPNPEHELVVTSEVILPMTDYIDPF